MDAELTSFLIVLSILWFFVYWILGGVFFAVVTVMRLGRLRKVRFSCLFSLLALALGVGAAYLGVRGSQQAVDGCLASAATSAEKVTAVFGCGAASIFGTFLLGALALTVGGFLIMSVSKSKSPPWIVLEPVEGTEESVQTNEHQSTSRFFQP